MTTAKPKTIDEYIAGFPADVQEKLEQIRATIKSTAPETQETIKYVMPTFTLNGKNLVHFAAFKNHIGFYPTPNGIDAFKEKLSAYKSAKGSAQFPHDQPLPMDLIVDVVKYRMQSSS